MMRDSRQLHGFSLLELVCVVALIVLVMGFFRGTAWHVQSAMQVHKTAEEFLQTVKTARRYAIDHQCRTRIAFRRGLYEDAENLTEEDYSYRIHAFVVPSSLPGDAGRWVPVADALTGMGTAGRTEWARVELNPRSASLVGRWMVCDLDPKMKKVSDDVKLTSTLFTHFKDSSRDQFFADNFYSPETVWAAEPYDPHEPENCLSTYPEDYRMTPTDAGPLLMTAPLPENERCADPLSGEMVATSTFWPGPVSFIRGGDPAKLEELPGIEFQPDGALACTWTREIEVRFAREHRPQPSYLIVIDATTGMARIVEETGK